MNKNSDVGEQKNIRKKKCHKLFGGFNKFTIFKITLCQNNYKKISYYS